MSPLFIASSIVSRIIKAAAVRGVDAVELCLAAGIDPAEVEDVDARISLEPYLRLWMEVTRRIADPGFSLSVPERLDRGHNLLRFVTMNSETIGEALERAGRYLRLLTNAVSWPLERGANVSVLAMVRAEERAPDETRYPDEFGCAEVVGVTRRFSGVEWNPVAVHFAFAEPPDVTPHRALFRAPLFFSRPRTEIHIATPTLALPLLRADPAAVAFFESHIQKLLGTDPGERTAAAGVREVVTRSTDGDIPTLEKVAAALGMSGRTLRRRLAEEGHSFQHLLDATRFASARRHLEDGHLSVAEIAFLLGFSEASAFHRAFRRWAGTTPQAYARASRKA